MENHAHFTFAELKWGICILFPIVNFLGRRHVIGQSQLLASHVTSHEYVSEYHQCSRWVVLDTLHAQTDYERKWLYIPRPSCLPSTAHYQGSWMLILFLNLSPLNLIFWLLEDSNQWRKTMERPRNKASWTYHLLAICLYSENWCLLLPTDPISLALAFSCLRTLFINKMNLSWSQVRRDEGGGGKWGYLEKWFCLLEA